MSDTTSPPLMGCATTDAALRPLDFAGFARELGADGDAWSAVHAAMAYEKPVRFRRAGAGEFVIAPYDANHAGLPPDSLASIQLRLDDLVERDTPPAREQLPAVIERNFYLRFAVRPRLPDTLICEIPVLGPNANAAIEDCKTDWKTHGPRLKEAALAVLARYWTEVPDDFEFLFASVAGPSQ